MPGKPIKIGPFTGGLNNMSTAGESKDNELTQLVNMEVTKDESLTSRPPIVPVAGTVRDTSHTWEILGTYRVTETEWYLIVMNPQPTGWLVQAYLKGDLTSTTPFTIKTLSLSDKVSDMTQFKGELYFLTPPESTAICFKWSKGAPTTNVTSMPRGNVLISWKTRLWVSGTMSGNNADRIWFSYVGAEGPEPGKWEANDFFDVAPGEGGYITALVPSFNNLIVFKNDGTWRFSFPSSPKQGTIDKISGQVGASGKRAAVEFENFIYVYDQGYVYELVNSNLAQLNMYVHFNEDPKAVDGLAPGVELSIVNRRLIVRYFNALYVYTVDTKAWSLWHSFNGVPGRFQELPVDSASSNPSVYLAPTRGITQSADLNLIPDEIDTSKGTDGTVTRYLNLNNDESDFNIPITPSQQLTLKYVTTAINAGTGIRIRFMLGDGTISSTDYPFTANQNFSSRFRVPSNAVMAQIAVYATTAKALVTDIRLERESLTSPSSLLKLSDTYPDSLTPVEFIEMEMLTKTYDYQAATSFKRLFYWGADLVTPRQIVAEARPVGRKNSITWGDLEKYTWNELSKGTWGNPLSWLNRSTSILSVTSENVDISENGRFYVKLKKNLRFRQIAFYLKLTSLGNKETGPAKIFALTTLVNPKKDTIDTVT